MRASASWLVDRWADLMILLGVIWVLVLIGAASFGV